MHMQEQELKEAYRLFWMVKGHLNAPQSTVLESYNGYFKRMWFNEESYVHMEGFEEAWAKKMSK